MTTTTKDIAGQWGDLPQEKQKDLCKINDPLTRSELQ